MGSRLPSTNRANLSQRVSARLAIAVLERREAETFKLIHVLLSEKREVVAAALAEEGFRPYAILDWKQNIHTRIVSALYRRRLFFCGEDPPYRFTPGR